MKVNLKIAIILIIVNTILLYFLWVYIFNGVLESIRGIEREYIAEFNFLIKEQINLIKSKIILGDYNQLQDIFAEISLPRNYESIIVFNIKGNVIAAIPLIELKSINREILQFALSSINSTSIYYESDWNHINIVASFAKDEGKNFIGGIKARIVAPEIVYLKNRLSYQSFILIICIVLFTIVLNYIMIKIMIWNKLIQATKTLSAILDHEKKITALSVSEKDEFFEIYTSLNQLIKYSESASEQANSLVSSMKTILNNIDNELTNLYKGISNQSVSSEEIISTINWSHQSLQVIIENMEELEHSTEVTNGFIFEMQATVEQITSYIDKLVKYLDTSLQSAKQIASSIRTVSNSIDELSSGVSEIVASTAEMDYATRQVELNSKDAYQISINTMKSAETGSDYVIKTIDSINEVKKSIEVTSHSIDMLIENTEAVSKILLVIKEITEQTNLLSLNASILAAQAGEYGRSFAVVAHEIKNLAEKTANSTKEIKSLLAQIQHYSQETREAMNSSEESINTSIQISSKAGNYLKDILNNVKSVVEIVQLISNATSEQSRGSKQITEAMERVENMAQNISKSVTELSKAYEEINATSGEIKALSHLIKSQLIDHTKGQKDITSSIEKIASLTNAIKESIAAQKTNFEKIYNLSTEIVKSNNALTKNISELSKANSETEKVCKELINKIFA